MAETDDGLGKTRMEALSDGVFAVALTLLLADFATSHGIEEWFDGLSEKLRLFFGTFLIVSVYWVAHNNECRYIQVVDRMVLWLNLLFLASVVVSPLSLAVFAAKWPATPHAVEAGYQYLINMILIGVLFTVFLAYLAGRRTSSGRRLITSEGQRYLPEAFVRNLSLPVAYAIVLYCLAVWASEKKATTWLVGHLDWAILFPAAGYVIMTLLLPLLPTEWRKAAKTARLHRRPVVMACLAIFAVAILVAVIAIGPRDAAIVVVWALEGLAIIVAFFASRARR
jgi:uncharacterized membrane protein